MTDLTTRLRKAETPGPLPAPAPANGAAVADVRSLRQVSRAEQDRLSADAEVERRARAGRLDLELREQRAAAARREREANAAEKRARDERRRTRRGARWARLRTAAPVWAQRALFVLPIMFPMAVAWVGQIRFAMTVMGWPLPAAVVFAAGFELSTAYVARLDWLSRAAGDSGLLFRGATWGFAVGAASMNYWHAAGPHLAPTGEAVSYALMSVTGVLLWELLSTYRHRTALRAEGKLPAARPRFGLARWIWFHKLTRLAWLLTLRDGYTTTDVAWRAALGAADVYGSAKDARKAVRAGHPASRSEASENERDSANQTAEHRDGETRNKQRDTNTQREALRGPDRNIDLHHLARDEQQYGQIGPDGRDTVGRATLRDRKPGIAARPGQSLNTGSGKSPSELGGRAPSGPGLVHQLSTSRAGSGPADPDTANPDAPAADPNRRGDHTPAPQNQTPEGEHDPDGTSDDQRRNQPRVGGGQDPGAQAMNTRMLAYARQRLAEGTPITGADLDRQFGTRDYGRKVLRRLTTQSTADGD